MQDAERIAPCVLVVQHSDRLARGDGRTARHLGEIYFWAIKAGIEIRSVQDDSTFTNPLLTFAMGERNAEDSRRKSLAVAAGMKRRAQAGKATGGPRPYGYRYGTDGLEVVPEEAEIVRRMFSELLAGRSICAIARDLQHDGIPTLRGGLWRQPTVSGILRNVQLTGKVEYDGETFDANHDAIVDERTFQRAQTLLASHVSRRGRRSKGRHLFRGGMLRCECGEPMIPRTRDGYELYYCEGHAKHGSEFCPQGAVRRAVIDTAVYDYFERVGLDVEATRQQLADERDRKLAEIAALRRAAEREAHRAEERLRRVRRDYTDGRLDADDWKDFKAELTAELDAARAEVDRLTRSEADVGQDYALQDAEREVLERLADIRRTIGGEIQDAEGVDAVRAALSRLFSAFILHPERNSRYKGQGRSELVGAGPELMIELRVREQALIGYSEQGMYPVLHREPLRQADNKQHHGLPWRYASGPE
jgi:hypothetical protein